MDMDVLIAGVIVSAIGAGMAIYGKKAVRLVPLVIGLALMVVPFVFSTLLGLSLVTAGLLLGAYLLRDA